MVESKRTYIVVVATVPDVAVNVNVVENPVVVFVDITKPAGAVTLISLFSVLPYTVKLLFILGVPYTVVNAAIVPLAVIVASLGATGVASIILLLAPFPVVFTALTITLYVVPFVKPVSNNGEVVCAGDIDVNVAPLSVEY